MRKYSQKRLDLIAFLAALCLFFSTIEYLFPKPFPFVRLGLANLPILIALDLLFGGELFLLLALKVVGQGLINGTLASYVFLFSAAGSLASMLVMWGAHRLIRRHITLVGISLLGSLASNAIQITLSVTFIFGDSAWVIAPLFGGIGVVSGLIVGLFAERFRTRSAWLTIVREQIDGP
jgi:heptaprenyl diphosphate synthase